VQVNFERGQRIAYRTSAHRVKWPKSVSTGKVEWSGFAKSRSAEMNRESSHRIHPDEIVAPTYLLVDIMSTMYTRVTLLYVSTSLVYCPFAKPWPAHCTARQQLTRTGKRESIPDEAIARRVVLQPGIRLHLLADPGVAAGCQLSFSIFSSHQ
jgi:hypothetical protein